MTSRHREARDVMTPGVVSIPDDASMRRVYGALRAHRIHALLVVDHRTGTPLGWVSATGLLATLAGERRPRTAAQAIDEAPVRISPSASLAEAAAALKQSATTHLLVCHGEQNMPEGVISALDLVPLAPGYDSDTGRA